MKELVELLAKNIVSKPKAIRIEETTANGQDLIKLSIAPEDMGRVIGRAGRVIKAIRNLLKIKAIKSGRRVYLELTEQDKDRPEPETSH